MDDVLHGKRVLVTGAAGFVGANLTRELVRRGAEVHALVRPSTKLWRIAEIVPQLTLHLVDLVQREKLQEIINEARPEVIFHLAVERAHHSQRDHVEMLQTNLVGTFNLLEATRMIGYQRFVQLGSSLEYGVRERPLKESDRLEPLTFYGATKAAATLLCQQLARANRLPIVVLHPFTVYGYWQTPTSLVPTAIRAALHGQKMALTARGYRRDYVFVEDVIEACLLSLRAEGVFGETINVGSGQQWTNQEVVEMVQTVSGQTIGLRADEYPPLPFDTNNWVADNRKAKRLLGWEPHHTLRSGLEKTIAWFRQHQGDYEDRS